MSAESITDADRFIMFFPWVEDPDEDSDEDCKLSEDLKLSLELPSTDDAAVVVAFSEIIKCCKQQVEKNGL